MSVRLSLSIMLFLALTLAVPLKSYAQGFLYEVEVKSAEDIKEMTDDELKSTFIEVEIDLEAVTTFHDAAGINLKDFRKFKELLRYRYYLMAELQKREIKPPKIKP